MANLTQAQKDKEELQAFRAAAEAASVRALAISEAQLVLATNGYKMTIRETGSITINKEGAEEYSTKLKKNYRGNVSVTPSMVGMLQDPEVLTAVSTILSYQ